MPLNYSKWDTLEVSDDSDIEGHPNVDHKSLVRWKQRDIHEKREAAKRRIAEYELIIATNEGIIPRLQAIIKDTEDGGPEKYSALVEKFKRAPSSEKPKGGQIPYDSMLADVMFKVRDELKEKGVSKPDASQLVERLGEHLEKLRKADKEAKEALKDELKEKSKKITSDDIHEGFSTTKITKEEPVVPEEPKKWKKQIQKAEEIEVLNPKAATASTLSAPSIPLAASLGLEEDEQLERIPDLTPELEEFSKIPLGSYDESYEYIKQHAKKVLVSDAYDLLVIGGFRAAVKGNTKYAKQCVHQALLVQYCDKLGKDGVQLFFKRMSSKDPRAVMAFNKDLDDTLKMLLTRAEEARVEEVSGQGQGQGSERIQLVAEDPSQTIGFNVPDGPPPEEIKLEGPGTEDLDPEEVKEALQRRWDIFEGFEDNLKEALRAGQLEKVNKVLAEMDVPRAEEVVQLLDIGGILNFSSHDVLDQTGNGDQEAEA